MQRIVFVVGAGASLDFGLPLGSQLVDRIRNQLTAELRADDGGYILIRSAMSSGKEGDYGRAARKIAGGLNAARSIDRLLFAHRGDPLVAELGKRAIAFQIGLAEEQCPLAGFEDADWHNRQLAMGNMRSTWLARLFAQRAEGVQPSSSGEIFRGLSFITFNYDRVIEAYLQLALEHIQSLTAAESASIVARIPIEHVYGRLSPLATHDNNGISMGFPMEEHAAYLGDLAANLRTFTEQQDEESVTRCRRLITQADAIIFLGFAYDPLNLEVLFEDLVRADQLVLGTARGVGPTDRQFAADRITLPGHGPRFYDMDCPSLIDTDEVRGLLKNR